MGGLLSTPSCVERKKGVDASIQSVRKGGTVQREEEEEFSDIWMILACCTERKFKRYTNPENDRAMFAHLTWDDIEPFTAYIPDAIREAIVDRKIHEGNQFDIMIKRCKGAVVFCDASGFTALTEKLAVRPDGAEVLSNCISGFFTEFLKVVKEYGGDVIKFSGDAITIVFPAEGTEEILLGNQAKAPMSEEDIQKAVEIACHLACQCCIDVHKSIEDYETGVEGVNLTLHIGVGCGDIALLQLGGILDRWEYCVAGPPLSQISIAEPLAQSGETVISPEVYKYVKDHIVAPPSTEDFSDYPEFKKLLDMKTRLPIPGGIQFPPMQPSDMPLIRRYIPPAIFRRILEGQRSYIEEMRTVSVIFMCVQGLDVASPKGSSIAHQVMTSVQRSVYAQEGSVNKFLVDDKGVLLLAVFGLPPLSHSDDPARAVMAGLRMLHSLEVLNLKGLVGVATGRVWCGVVGAPHRREYTVLGDSVNLSARLMSNASKDYAGKTTILVDETTAKACEDRIQVDKLAPIMVKGKTQPIQVYRPTGKTISKPGGVLISDLPISTWPLWEPRRQAEDCLSVPIENDPNTFDRRIASVSAMLRATRGREIDMSEDPAFEIAKNTGLLTVGGVINAAGHAVESVPIGNIMAEIAKKHDYIVCQGCNKGNYMHEVPEDSHENLPLIAWEQLLRPVFDKLRAADAAEWGFSERRISDVIESAVPAALRSSVIEVVGELAMLSSDLKQELYQEAKKEERQEAELEASMRRLEAKQRKENNFPKKKNRKAFDALIGGSHHLSTAQVRRGTMEELSTLGRKSVKFREGVARLEDEDSSGLSQKALAVVEALVERAADFGPLFMQLYVRNGTSVLTYMDSDSWALAQVVANTAVRRRNLRAEAVADFIDTSDFRKVSPEALPHPIIFSLIAPARTAMSVPQQAHIENLAKQCSSFIEVRELEIHSLARYLIHSQRLLPSVIMSAPPNLSATVNSLNASATMAPRRSALIREQHLNTSGFGTLDNNDGDQAKNTPSVPYNLLQYVFDMTCGQPQLADATIETLLKEKYIRWVSVDSSGTPANNTPYGSTAPNGTDNVSRQNSTTIGAGLGRFELIKSPDELLDAPMALPLRLQCQNLLDRLQPDQQTLVKAASSLDEKFDANLLASLYPKPISVAQCARLLNELITAGVFVVVGERDLEPGEEDPYDDEDDDDDGNEDIAAKGLVVAGGQKHSKIPLLDFRQRAVKLVTFETVLVGQRTEVGARKSRFTRSSFADTTAGRQPRNAEIPQFIDAAEIEALQKKQDEYLSNQDGAVSVTFQMERPGEPLPETQTPTAEPQQEQVATEPQQEEQVAAETEDGPVAAGDVKEDVVAAPQE